MDFTGFEIEPNVRFLTNVTKNQTVWGAISRAVRTPAITEEGLRAEVGCGSPRRSSPFFAPIPVIESVFGSTNFKSEDLLAYEIGYRVQATNTISADVAAFYNNYTNLRTAEPGTPFLEGTTDEVIPFVAENKMSGGTYGIEPFVDWKVRPMWKLFASYTYLEMNIHEERRQHRPHSRTCRTGESPKNQFAFSARRSICLGTFSRISACATWTRCPALAFRHTRRSMRACTGRRSPK